jgi:hypothetical protein
MNVEFRTEAAQFPEKEYIKGIFFAVHGGIKLSYRFITAQDLRATIDHIHWDSTELKSATISDLPRYVRRDARLPRLLSSLRAAGRKVFLLTNREHRWTIR